mgnify:CR=1 FL=1
MEVAEGVRGRGVPAYLDMDQLIAIAREHSCDVGELAKATNTLILPASVSDVGSMIALAMNAVRQTSPPAPGKS